MTGTRQRGPIHQSAGGSTVSGSQSVGRSGGQCTGSTSYRSIVVDAAFPECCVQGWGKKEDEVRTFLQNPSTAEPKLRQTALQGFNTRPMGLRPGWGDACVPRELGPYLV